MFQPTTGIRCSATVNTNYANTGNDFINQNVSTISQCCDLCGGTAGCVGWSYLTSPSWCFLKNAASTLYDYNGMVSGTR
jgi:hypothetical protein